MKENNPKHFQGRVPKKEKQEQEKKEPHRARPRQSENIVILRPSKTSINGEGISHGRTTRNSKKKK